MHAVERVDRPWPRGQHHHRRFSGNARVAFGSHRTSLLMVHESAAQPLMPSQRLIEEHGTTAGDSENLLDPLLHQPLCDLLGDTRHGQSPRLRMRFLREGLSL
ncbi:hypothetical protein D3C78_1228890 [compost metagenome]